MRSLVKINIRRENHVGLMYKNIFMKTIWKDIPGYEILYQVSDWGIVRSKERFRIEHTWKKVHVKERILRAEVMKDWYLRVSLCRNWEIIRYSIHRLVATSFLWLKLKFNWNNLVCHKNDIRDDNRVDNLFLWTYSDNTLDCVNKWRSVNNKWEKSWLSKLTNKQADLIRELRVEWISRVDVANMFNVALVTITRITKKYTYNN